MQVVPALAEGDQRHKPIVAAGIAGGERLIVAGSLYLIGDLLAGADGSS
jgi:hypothetical protein